jgi:hypothetical protein
LLSRVSGIDDLVAVKMQFLVIHYMAKLPEEILTSIFELLLQLAEQIEYASATEWQLFTEYGENDQTLSELEELFNARERVINSYSRINNILLRILQEQPTLSDTMLEMLERAILQGTASVDSVNASVDEVKRQWNLL